MALILGIETSCDETSASVIEGSGDDVTQRSLVILSPNTRWMSCDRITSER